MAVHTTGSLAKQCVEICLLARSRCCFDMGHSSFKPPRAQRKLLSASVLIASSTLVAPFLANASTAADQVELASSAPWTKHAQKCPPCAAKLTLGCTAINNCHLDLQHQLRFVQHVIAVDIFHSPKSRHSSPLTTWFVGMYVIISTNYRCPCVVPLFSVLASTIGSPFCKVLLTVNL